MCFMACTQIISQDGLVNIENIKKGDSVLSKSTKDGKQDYKKVLNLFVTNPTELFHITYQDAKGDAYTLKTTGEHPFFVSDKGWVIARELSIADRLQISDDSAVAISDITTEKAKDGTFTTYNFEVEDYHTYYALPEGKTDGKYAVWVHNNGDECAEVVGSVPAGKMITGRTNGKPDIFDYADPQDAYRRGLGFGEEGHHFLPTFLGGAEDGPILLTRMGIHRGAGIGIHQNMNDWLVKRDVIPKSSLKSGSSVRILVEKGLLSVSDLKRELYMFYKTAYPTMPGVASRLSEAFKKYRY